MFAMGAQTDACTSDALSGHSQAKSLPYPCCLRLEPSGIHSAHFALLPQPHSGPVRWRHLHQGPCFVGTIAGPHVLLLTRASSPYLSFGYASLRTPCQQRPPVGLAKGALVANHRCSDGPFQGALLGCAPGCLGVLSIAVGLGLLTGLGTLSFARVCGATACRPTPHGR